MKRKNNPHGRQTYTLLQEMTASTTQPMPVDFQRHQLTRMWSGLANLETAANPTNDDWRVVSDAVNLMETLVNFGPWQDLDGDPCEIKDERGLLPDALAGLAIAGARHLQDNKPLRLDGWAIVPIRSLLEDYRDILAALPHRTMIRVHRITEREARAALAGNKTNKNHTVIAA